MALRSHHTKPCRYGAECYAFQRLCDRGDRLDDRCHARIYEHPARDRYAKLQQMYEAQLAKQQQSASSEAKDVEPANSEKYTPFVYLSAGKLERSTFSPPESFWFWREERQLTALMNEVQRNGFTDDLKTRDGDSILVIVDRKMAHPRCKEIQARLRQFKSEVDESWELTRPMMLALVLYTGCDCTYDMCVAERSGDYQTW